MSNSIEFKVKKVFSILGSVVFLFGAMISACALMLYGVKFGAAVFGSEFGSMSIEVQVAVAGGLVMAAILLLGLVLQNAERVRRVIFKISGEGKLKVVTAGGEHCERTGGKTDGRE